MTQREQLAIKWCDVQDVHLLSTVRDDRMVGKPKLRGAREKTKPNSVMDYSIYKIGVDKCDQIFSYYSSENK